MATITSPRPGSFSRVLEMFSVKDVCWVLVPDAKWPEHVGEMCLMRCEKIDAEFDGGRGRLLMRDVDDSCCWWPVDRVVTPASLGVHASEAQIRKAMRPNGLVEGADGATSAQDCRMAWERMWKAREERRL